MKRRALTLVATIGLLGATAFVASGSTGAYFSDTHTGVITGTIGTIRVTPSGGTASSDGSLMDLAFNNLLPGAAQTVTVNYQNTGSSAEDVWVVFPNATALSSLNNSGSYATVHLSAVGTGVVNGGDLFDSANLNDRSATCGPFSPSGCWPVPNAVLVAQNVGPTAGGAFTFSYMLASALTGQPAGLTAPWNTYPLPGYGGSGLSYAACIAIATASQCSNNQTTVNAGDGSGNGLPYEIVATQPGIQPGAVGTHP
jgi:hypothetical protein